MMCHNDKKDFGEPPDSWIGGFLSLPFSPILVIRSFYSAEGGDQWLVKLMMCHNDKKLVQWLPSRMAKFILNDHSALLNKSSRPNRGKLDCRSLYGQLQL